VVERRVVGGKRLTPDDAWALIIFRHVYGMDRAMVASLPVWERSTLLEGGRSILGLDDENGGPSEAQILSTPGVG
jgi:hypothetical protein